MKGPSDLVAAISKRQRQALRSSPLLFCRWGRDRPAFAGVCRWCYLRHWRQHFAGLHKEVLEREGHRPGVNGRDLWIAVCARCHAPLHRLAALRVSIPEPLVALWIEQHPGTPVQLPAV
jgi:hypothetical protein